MWDNTNMSSPSPFSCPPRNVTNHETSSPTPRGCESDPHTQAGESSSGHNGASCWSNSHPVAGLTLTLGGGCRPGRFVTFRGGHENGFPRRGARVQNAEKHPSTAVPRGATVCSAASPSSLALAGGFRGTLRGGSPGRSSRLGASEAELVDDRLADEIARAHACRVGGFGHGIPFSGREPSGRYRCPNVCRRHANVNVARRTAPRADGRAGGAR